MTRTTPRPWHRLDLKWQLMIPFGFLALIWATSGTYLLTRTAMSRAESRIDGELYDALVQAGTTFTDLVAGEVELQRLAAHTQGLSDVLSRGDGASVHGLLEPLLVNSRADTMVVLDPAGREQTAMWRTG